MLPSRKHRARRIAAQGMFCLVCEKKVDAFLPYGIPARIGRCPHCGATLTDGACPDCSQRLADLAEAEAEAPTMPRRIVEVDLAVEAEGEGLGTGFSIGVETRRRLRPRRSSARRTTRSETSWRAWIGTVRGAPRWIGRATT